MRIAIVRRSLIAVLLASLAVTADESKVGEFDGQADVGSEAPAGTGQFDKATGEYKVSSGGENIWGKHDDFHFVYRKLSGDVTLTADVTLVGEGKVLHRKGGCMIRQGLEADDPYVDVVVHGDGSIGLQYRLAKGEITAGVKPADLKTPATIRLERRGDVFTAYASPKGEKPGEFKVVGTIKAALKEPVYVGLVLSAHDAKAVENAVFSHVEVKVGGKQ